MNRKTQEAYRKFMDELDKAVKPLTKAEYADFLDNLGSEVEAREDCLKDEGEYE